MDKQVTVVSYAYRAPTALYANINRKQAQAGGAEIFLDQLIQLLQDYDREVFVIQGGLKAGEVKQKRLTLRTIRVPQFARALGIPEQWWAFNWAWPKALPNEPGHIHLHHAQHAYPGAPATATATFHGVTWDIPRAAMQTYVGGATAGIAQAGYTRGEKFLTRFAVNRLARIASVDSFLLRYVQSELPDQRDKIDVIPNFVDTKQFHPDVDSRKIRAKSDNRPLILFPRNLSFSRGVQFLPAALEHVRQDFPEALLMIVGGGNAKPWLEKEIAGWGLEHNVLLAGHVTHADLPAYYAAADVVIIPTSHFEGTSLSALEAMATGKPVIATNVGGLPDLIEDELSGLIIQPHAEQLGRAITRILADPTLAKRLGRAARFRAETHFSLERWRDSYRRFLGL